MAVVLITGCSSGLGLEMAVEFARGGDTVYASMRNTGKAATLRERTSVAGFDVRVVQLDVTGPASIAAAVKHIAAEAGTPDVLVNNAAIMPAGPVEETADDEVRSVFETNTFGPLRLACAVLPGMRERGSGLILNIASVSGLMPLPTMGIYSASKAALDAAMESLRWEVAPFGICVTAVEPGRFDTQIVANRMVPRMHTTTSPYFARMARWDAAMDGLGAQAGVAPAAAAAQTICAIAREPAPRQRYAIGEDAELLLAMKRQLAPDEFEANLHQMLWFWDAEVAPAQG